MATRFSARLTKFAALLVATLAGDDLKAARAAFARCFADEGQRELPEGRGIAKSVKVSLGPLGAALPASLHSAFEAFHSAFIDECTERGADWTREGAHLALRDYLPILASDVTEVIPEGSAA